MRALVVIASHFAIVRYAGPRTTHCNEEKEESKVATSSYNNQQQHIISPYFSTFVGKKTLHGRI
jgi:hypothetical protein